MVQGELFARYAPVRGSGQFFRRRPRLRVAISDLSSPCGDDAGPSADPASDTATLATERDQLEPDREVYLAKRASFIEKLAKLLCWAHLERSLRQHSTPKQVAAQMREYRKRHWRDTSRELQTDVCASLSAASSNDLEHIVAAIRCVLDDEPPLNDIRWIMSLASQPVELLPDRSLALQRMQQAIYFSWRERVGAEEASFLAKTAAELADNTLYLMALRLLWSLLSSDQQLEVQQWFRRYARTSGPSGDASASSSSKPRPGLDGKEAT